MSFKSSLINNRFFTHIKTNQVLLFPKIESEIIDRWVAPLSKPKRWIRKPPVKKDFVFLYHVLLQEQLKQKVKSFNKFNWIYLKDKNSKVAKDLKLLNTSSFNTKAEYKSFSCIHIKGFTPEKEPVFGFRKLKPNTLVTSTWDRLKTKDSKVTKDLKVLNTSSFNPKVEYKKDIKGFIPGKKPVLGFKKLNPNTLVLSTWNRLKTKNSKVTKDLKVLNTSSKNKKLVHK